MPRATRSKTYDSNGNLDLVTDFNGVVTDHDYDTRGLETRRIDAANASGANASSRRTTETTWNANFRVPDQRTVKNASNVLEARTTWAYNTRGQATARCEIDPGDAAAMGYACSATTAPSSGAKVRRTVTTYCEEPDVTAGICPRVGLVKSVNGPRPAGDDGMSVGQDDVTTYAYYQTDDSTCASNGACTHRHGDLWKVTNALGHVTEYVAYDKAGRLTRLKDANGTYTDFAYHPRGWLTDRIVRASATGAPGAGDATTHIDYDAVGNVKKVTQPDGAFLAYTYDDAHRLIKIADNLGNSIDYCPGGAGSAQCLDAAGNRRVEEVWSPGPGPAQMKRAVAREYNQLSQLVRVTNASAQPVEQSQGLAETGVVDGYDRNGNRVLVQDGLGTKTRQRYDGLDRLIESIQNVGGTDPATANTSTGYAYDARDNLRQVTDPDGLNTVYDYDGLNNLTGLHSPDTGNTSYTYDLAGNRRSQTDARGVTSTYTYDALNRLTGIAYPTTSLDVTYAYDQADAVTGCSGSYPLGRMTTMTDASGSTSYCYDRRGNVTVKTQVSGGVALATAYSYTSADRLASVTYPSGDVISYVRDVLGRVNTVRWTPYSPPGGSINRAVTVVSGTTYYPFGPLNVLTFANGRSLTKTYDKDYAIDSIVSSAADGLKLDFDVDVMGNIVGAKVPGAATPATYAYDPLYRLKSVSPGSSAGPAESWTYNKTGDRLSAQRNSDPIVPYTYGAASHRLASVGGVTRSYDANGNTTAGTAPGLALSYDDRNRLASAVKTGLRGDYVHNGRGERVKKTTTTGSGGPGVSEEVSYAYDEAGRLVGEYSAMGTALAEYVYLDDQPIAVVKDGTLAYIETDHLGTPRVVADRATGAALWTWGFFDGAFGTGAPNESPGGGAAYTLNLRFPGQQYDAESGLHYNYFRDYESVTGRYVQSDPIGLSSGMGTYVYVSNSPFVMRDMWGLIEDSASNRARRSRINQLANGYEGSTDWGLMTRKDNFGVGVNKCNKFVHDVLDEAGAPIVVIIGRGKERPPTAAEIANAKAMVPNWRPLRPGERPLPGDVAAYRIPGGGVGGTGHTGIITSCECEGGLSNQSAHQDVVGPVEGQFDLPDVVIRRYTGE